MQGFASAHGDVHLQHGQEVYNSIRGLF